jgi:hypothetical protein
MGELGRDWLRGVGVTVPVTGGGGNNQAWPLSFCFMANGSPTLRELVGVHDGAALH